jgi:glycosyltransferase involved in cell wall biosynthesis
MMKLTVAICTFRRPRILADALASLALVRRPNIDWELLIVDNDAEQPVRDVVESFADKLPVRYVRESQRGIAHARNRAISEAAGPFVLFADDDVVFDEQWLCAMWRSIEQHGDCDFVGGRIEPRWSTDVPAWFDLSRCPMLGDTIVRYDGGDEPRPFDPSRDVPFVTCNLALRVEAVRQAGMFDVTLGHRGKRRGTGEDTWMIKSIVLAGGKGWYAADALVHHPVPIERLSKTYARRFAWRQGAVSVDMLRRESQGRLPNWVYALSLQRVARGARMFAAGLLRHDRGEAFAGQFDLLFNVSKLCHALRRG